MTATLAEDFLNGSAHMARVRDDYERTKARHAGEPPLPRVRVKKPARPKDRCKHGHKLTEANTYVYTDKRGTHRWCRICRADRSQRLRDRKKAAANA